MQALERPTGVLLVQARGSRGCSAMGVWKWREGNESLGSTSRASAGRSHCHSSAGDLLLACSAGSVRTMETRGVN